MDNATKLLELAKEKFGNLTEAEEKLFQAVANGQVADYSAKDANDNDPAGADNWSIERVLKSDHLAWLCKYDEALELVTHRGILVRGARINGKLDLLFCRVSFPLILLKCAFTGDIDLQNGSVSTLSLSGTHTGPINARGLQVERDVFFDNGFKAEGPVHLIGATIGGNLQCAKCQFIDKEAIALNADMMRIEGSVLLGNGFRSEGEVRIVNATIGGVLVCEHGQFINEKGKALNADNLKVGSNIHLRTGFKARGKVSLLGARIGGNLDCYGGLFININKKGVALDADTVKVEGSILLRDHFKAEGEVRLVGARIGGDLDCSDAQFINEDAGALSADRLKVGGCVFLRNGFKAEGEVRLTTATIGANLECHRGQFINPHGYALNATDLTVEGNISLEDGFRAEGSVSLSGATVDNHLIWTNTKSPEKAKLDLRSAKIGTLQDDEKSWPERGEISLHGLVYDEIHDKAPTDAKARIEWLRRQYDKQAEVDKNQFRPQPYEQLATVFRKSGHEVDAKKILIAKNEDKARLTRLTCLEKLWYCQLGPIIGYGYRPMNSLRRIVALIIFGWILFGIGYWDGLITPQSESAYVKRDTKIVIPGDNEHQLSDVYPRFNFLVYSVDVFVPLVDLHQAKYWLPNANRGSEILNIKGFSLHTGGVLRSYMWIHICLGWMLTTLLVVGLTGLVRT